VKKKACGNENRLYICGVETVRQTKTTTMKNYQTLSERLTGKPVKMIAARARSTGVVIPVSLTHWVNDMSEDEFESLGDWSEYKGKLNEFSN
jgi:hypothetical protein